MHRLLVALLLTQGCAFGIDGPDPNRPRSQPPKCDTGKGAVVLDGTVAALSGVVALSLASNDEGAAALVPLSIGALYVAGAIAGNSAANRCREANADFESYLAERDAMPEERPQLPTRREPERPPAPAPAVAASPPAVTAPPPAPTPAPAVATPKPAPAAAPQPAATKLDRDDAGEWSAFWREVE